MKANPYGTMVEQDRARMGWQTATERKASGADLTKTCRGCKHFNSSTYSNREGGVGVSLRCWHPKTAGAGFATRETAACDAWERDLS
jgi:hypothetical protein